MTKKIIFKFSILFTLTQLLFLLYQNHMEFLKVQTFSSNLFVSPHAISIVFQDNDHLSAEELHEIIKEYPNIKLFHKAFGNDEIQIYGFCGNSTFYPDINKFVNGRFIGTEDLFVDSAAAVVGKNIVASNYCIFDQNQHYFVYGEKWYAIQGIISSHVNNVLDDAVFINLDALYAVPSFKITRITIDGLDKEIKDVGNQILDKHKAYQVKNNYNFIEQYIIEESHEKRFYLIMFIFIVTLIVANSILLLISFGQEIGVRKILGIPFIKTFTYILKCIGILGLINILIVGTLYKIIHLFFLKHFYLEDQIIELFIFSCTGLFVILIIEFIGAFIFHKLIYKNGVK